MRDVRVAIFPSYGLGDGLIQLVLANNLRLNGYEVTFYSDHLQDLDPYVPGITIRKFPAYDDVRDEIGDANIVLYDALSRFTLQLPKDLAAWFSTNGIAYSLAYAPPAHRSITADRIRLRLPETRHEEADRFVRFNTTIRDRGMSLHRRPVAHQLARFTWDALELEERTYANGLRLPVPGEERVANRVVIHPTSSRAIKNWSATKYVRLAERLENDGWEPVITVAPAEREAWIEIARDRFAVPLLRDAAQLAHYYARSFAFVGNDSGNAHLASCLGLPNLVVFGSWKRSPSWRPGWRQPTVIIARAPTRQHWQKFLSVGRVYRGFRRMVRGAGKRDTV